MEVILSVVDLFNNREKAIIVGYYRVSPDFIKQKTSLSYI